MTNEQVAVVIGLIQASLTQNIEKLELVLKDSEFCQMVGYEGNVFNPYIKSYPILEGLYQLQSDLDLGLKLLIPKSQK